MVTIERRASAHIFVVEKRQKGAMGLKERKDSLHQWFYKRFRHIIRDIPAEYRVKLGLGISQILGEKPVRVELF
jgi:hypothetical protein